MGTVCANVPRVALLLLFTKRHIRVHIVTEGSSECLSLGSQTCLHLLPALCCHQQGQDAPRRDEEGCREGELPVDGWRLKQQPGILNGFRSLPSIKFTFRDENNNPPLTIFGFQISGTCCFKINLYNLGNLRLVLSENALRPFQLTCPKPGAQLLSKSRHHTGDERPEFFFQDVMLTDRTFVHVMSFIMFVLGQIP